MKLCVKDKQFGAVISVENLTVNSFISEHDSDMKTIRIYLFLNLVLFTFLYYLLNWMRHVYDVPEFELPFLLSTWDIHNTNHLLEV
jgi:hypothetical protein